MESRRLVNGRAERCIDIEDRGLQYGDGLFETMALREGTLRFRDAHVERLTRGCERMQITPIPAAILEAELAQLTAGTDDGIVKLVVTRGGGARGYRPDRSAAPTRVLFLHPNRAWPTAHYINGIRLRLCATRLGCNPLLAGLKHLNRLEQVMARLEPADADAEEGLMLDDGGRIIAGTMTNVFLVEDGRVVTPALDRCGVAGVMRRVVLETAAAGGVETAIEGVSRARLAAAGEVFVTNALIGLWPVRACAGRELGANPVTRALMRALAARGVRECAV
jgi:4-amino-4-deoxychorismate lyase